MALVLTRGISPRDTSTGKTFSIVFAIIAFFVVAVCIVWGYFIPKWRFKHKRPSSTRLQGIGGVPVYGPSTPSRAPKYVSHFPSHPGVRGLHKASSLPIYNPRTETPFSSSPRNIETVHLRSITSTPTPDTQRKVSRTHRRPTHDYELPKTPGTLSQLALTGSLHDLGFEGDNESEPQRSTVPPVARLAGRPPPLTRQLALFPTPVSNSTKRVDTLAHPNLLFERLEKLDPREVAPSSDGSCIPGTTPVPERKRGGDRRKSTVRQSADEAKLQIARTGELGVAGGLSGQPSNTRAILESPIAVPNLIHKHKPKTSTRSISHRNDRWAGGVRSIPTRKASLQRCVTRSTEPLTGSASTKSDSGASTTPPTSPPPATNDPTLIPTPLRVRHAAVRAAAASPTPAQASKKHNFPSESSIARSPRKLAPFSLRTRHKSKRDARKSIGFYHPKSTLGTAITKPMPVRLKRSSWRGSSVYSRDTRGMSILGSPKCAARANHDRGKILLLKEPSPSRATSVDLVRSKIDGWNLHTADLKLSLPSLSLDRPQSDIGSQRPGLRATTDDPASVSEQLKQDFLTPFGLTMQIPKIYVGRPSDDVFGDGGSAQNSGRVLRRVLDMEMASTESNISKHYGRTAPGDAEWI